LILLPKSELDSLAWSPDGRTIAGANGLAGIWTMHLGQGQPVRLTRNEDDAQPVWSPDGSAIAFARLDYNYGGARDAIFLIGSDGRGLRRLVLGHQPSWQPRG
jgi:Tol biopolymer transport system component